MSSTKSPKLKPNQFCKSLYRATWKGIILSVTKHKKNHVTCTCLVVRTASGQIPRKRIVHESDIGWLQPIEPVDISMINKEWFKNIPE